MKRLAASVAVALAVAVGLDALGDLTQDRPDKVVAGSRSEILLEVRTRSAESVGVAAQRLWAACQGTVHNRLAEPGLVEVDGGRLLAVAEPAVGPRSWRRLKGCLEDVTLDYVKGSVVSKHDRLPAGGS